MDLIGSITIARYLYITTHVVVFNMSDEVRVADVAGKKVQWDQTDAQNPGASLFF